MTRQSTTRTSNRQQFWQRHLDSWSSSGLTQAQYCRNHSLNAWTFNSWKRRIESEQSTPTQFVAVELPSLSTADKLENKYSLRLRLPNEISIEVCDGFSQETLGRLIKTVTSIA